MKIFVGNVDEQTTQEELSALFERFGTVVSCAVMKQFAFVHMRDEERALKAIGELNGWVLHGRKMVVELSKPRPHNTWKIFVGNVSSACDTNELRSLFEVYGSVVECDVVKDYAFVHMEREGDAREAIENLNGRELKGKRINVEMSNKVQKRSSTNGSTTSDRSRRSHEYRESSQGRAEAYDQRRATEAAYASYAITSPYESYIADAARYDFDSRPRQPSPLYYARDRSPMRRSPNRSTYAAAQTSAALASQYRSQAAAYGSQAALASAYGNQASAALASAYGSQASALASAYGNQASALASAYGNQAAAAALAAAYGSGASSYGAQPSTYGTEAAVSYSTQASASYGTQGSSLSTAYGTQVSALTSPYGAQTSTSPYASQTAAASPYESSSALANAYRQQTSAYEASQLAALGQQAAYSTLPAVATESPVYERTRLSPPRSAPDNYKKSSESLKRHLQRNCPEAMVPPRQTWSRPPPAPTRAAAHCQELETHSPDPRCNEQDFGVLHEVDPIQAARKDHRHHHRQAVWVRGHPAQGLRDSGATITLVQPRLVTSADQTGRCVAVRVARGPVMRIPTARVHLDCGLGAREVEVGIMKDLPMEVLLGNDLEHLTSSFTLEGKADAYPGTTRGQALGASGTLEDGSQVRENDANDNTPTIAPLPWSSPAEFVQETQTDPTLAPYRERAGKEPVGEETDRVELDRGRLYRLSESQKPTRMTKRQLIVPQKYRTELLRIGHDIPLLGHQALTRTKYRITQSFYWPGVTREVKDYLKTCETCLRVETKDDYPIVSTHPVPITDVPFSRTAIDLVGPLPKASPSGKKYILTVVDYATRYAEAIPLTNIHTESVADALLRVFARVGFPREIISDLGTQFTAEITQQLWKLCGIRPLQISPYDSETNGLCERFNGTLKQVLRTFTMEHRDWEKHLPHLLFAYREVPQETTGFSPFELVYGRRVRGPLDLLKTYWEEDDEAEGAPILEYVLAFRDRLKDFATLLKVDHKTAQRRYKRWYDSATRDRSFYIGQKVLVLKPTKQNKLQASWQGPYKVVKLLCDTTYLVARCSDEKVQRTFHVNMLKAYQEYSAEVAAICTPAVEDTKYLPTPELPYRREMRSRIDQVCLAEQLDKTQREQTRQLLGRRRDMFSYAPGYSQAAIHKVETIGQKPLRQAAFRVIEAVRAGMHSELREMLNLGMIEPSRRPWAPPGVLEPKRDGTTRFCVNYRKLNDHHNQRISHAQSR